MAYTGAQSPANRVLMAGSPLITEYKVETATNMYPGRLVVKGTNDDDIVIGDGVKPVCGFLGYEQSNPEFFPTTRTTAFAASAQAPVLSGGGYLILAPGGLASGTVAAKNDPLLSWSAGQVVPGVNLGGRYGIKIPFTKSTSEADTGIDLPAGIIVRDCIIQCTTAASSGTIDVGILSTETGGDADGFLDGESCAATGYVPHNAVDDATAKLTIGELIVEADIKTADTTALYYNVPVAYKTDGTAKSVSYTTSNHTVAGNIILILESPGIQLVGKCWAGVSAASEAADIQIEARI